VRILTGAGESLGVGLLPNVFGIQLGSVSVRPRQCPAKVSALLHPPLLPASLAATIPSSVSESSTLGGEQAAAIECKPAVAVTSQPAALPSPPKRAASRTINVSLLLRSRRARKGSRVQREISAIKVQGTLGPAPPQLSSVLDTPTPRGGPDDGLLQNRPPSRSTQRHDPGCRKS